MLIPEAKPTRCRERCGGASGSGGRSQRVRPRGVESSGATSSPICTAKSQYPTPPPHAADRGNRGNRGGAARVAEAEADAKHRQVLRQPRRWCSVRAAGRHRGATAGARRAASDLHRESLLPAPCSPLPAICYPTQPIGAIGAIGGGSGCGGGSGREASSGAPAAPPLVFSPGGGAASRRNCGGTQGGIGPASGKPAPCSPHPAPHYRIPTYRISATGYLLPAPCSATPIPYGR